MKRNIGAQYDKVAQWWHERLHNSDYGVKQVERAISYCKARGSALDVGCGSGGRIVRTLETSGFTVTRVDASPKMIDIAKANHASAEFHVGDLCDWHTNRKYDLIVAWDSLFHLPLAMHSEVIPKLCKLLNAEGIFIYTFGDGYGGDESDWHNDRFYYSTIGINENLKIAMEYGCECGHLELDQYPEKHVFMIVKKTSKC